MGGGMQSSTLYKNSRYVMVLKEKKRMFNHFRYLKMLPQKIEVNYALLLNCETLEK